MGYLSDCEMYRGESQFFPSVSRVFLSYKPILLDLKETRT